MNISNTEFEKKVFRLSAILYADNNYYGSYEA